MEFQLPELGEGVLEAELVSWLVQPGQQISQGQKLLEVITDKASVDIVSPFAGVVQQLKGDPGDMLRIGEVVLTYSAADSKNQARLPAKPPAREASPPHAAQSGNGTTEVQPPAGEIAPVRTTSAASMPAASPAVRHMARSLGIDLAQVPGSGPGGRVLVEDLAAHTALAAAESRLPSPGRKPEFGVPGTRIKLVGLRRKIAEHMVLAKQTIPHYTYVDECEITELIKLRKSLRENLIQHGEKTTTLAFYVKAVVAALKEVPIVNASIDKAAGEIVLHDEYHIGIATATSRGLVVPVVRHADRKSLIEVGHEIERLTSAAREATAARDELRGGTFTISSLSTIGGLLSTPVINHPEVAILGLGKVVKRPIYDAHGHLRPADMIYLSISFDHRVVDGAIGAQFGNALCRWLEHPATLLVPQ